MLNDRRVAISLSQEIPRLVREDHDIHLVDRDCGRDLTSLILSQIVIGEENALAPTMPATRSHGQATARTAPRAIRGRRGLAGL